MGVPLPEGVLGDIPPPPNDAANDVVSGTFSAVGPGIATQFYGAFNVAIWASLVDALTVTAGSLAATVASGASLVAGDTVNSKLVPPGTTVASVAVNAVTLALPQISLPCRYVKGQPYLTVLGDQSSGLLGAAVTGPGWPSGTTVDAVGATTGSGLALAAQTVLTLSNFATQNSAPAGTPVGGSGFNKLLFARTGNAILASGTDAAASFTGANIGYTGSVQLEFSVDGGQSWQVANIGGGGDLAQYSVGTPVRLIAGEPERGIGYRLNCTAYTGTGVVINYRLSTTGQAATVLAIPAGN